MGVSFRILIIVATGLLGLVGYGFFGVGTLVRVLLLGSAAAFGWTIFWSRSAFIGIAVSALAMVAAATFSPAFLDAIGPNTVWSTSTVDLGFPVPLLHQAFTFAVPALVAGGAVAAFAGNRLAATAAYAGIFLGCLWNIHLSLLSVNASGAGIVGDGTLVEVKRLSGSAVWRMITNAEYAFLIGADPLAGWIVSFLPLLCSLILLWLGNTVTGVRRSEY